MNVVKKKLLLVEWVSYDSEWYLFVCKFIFLLIFIFVLTLGFICLKIIVWSIVTRTTKENRQINIIAY